MNVEDDRLSSLPGDLIHKILSIIGLKRAIGTSTLSVRWRFLWTSMPCLDFSIEDFSTLPKFSQFVTNVLSRRSNLVEVFSIKLRFCGDVNHEFFKQIMNYAFSHNIQRLDVACLLEKDIEFPLSVFSSQSLKHLSLTREFNYRTRCEAPWSYVLTSKSTWELPALTTLNLRRLTLCDENDELTKTGNGLFSKCASLKSLTLDDCKMMGLNGLSICHPLLSDLTLDDVHGRLNCVLLIAPQLKNLTLQYGSPEHYFIAAPKLASLFYNGCHPLRFNTEGFSSLEKADICVSSLNNQDAHKIVRLFQQIRSVRFLRLNLEIVELLSSHVELISDHPSPFANLKRLKIYPDKELSEYERPKKIKMFIEVKNYLLENSPNATFTLISREEIRDMKNTKLAQKDMADFRVWLEREKSEIETNMAFMEEERKKAPMESHNTKRHKQEKTRSEYLLEIDKNLLLDDERIMENEERIMEINGCWKDLNWQIEKGNKKTCDIISKLHDIKEILIKLPTSTRDEMQECFSSLCAEADVVVNKILDRMKIHCDMKRSDFGVHFNDIASTSQPPS